MADGPSETLERFNRAIWSRLIDSHTEDVGWIDRVVALHTAQPTVPFADAGIALRRLLALGADPEDIASICRWVAYETAFGVVELIDAGIDEGDAGRGWQLIETDEEDIPTGRILQGLHEELLTADPSGREGRPVSDSAAGR
jgi:hypothetical protein